ncbi:hypothetical protein [Bacilliculturomica massiliensis]|uniref:hypothetical protein n=1 Tax=Bacilliculturomica massiliensis TaxID=1917867 RepID=UPI001030763B|nr:hypothetical protein [Bacilliculturomica massiliensis]
MNLDSAYKAVRKAIESQYDDICTIIAYMDIKNPETKRTTQREVVVVANQPCKISFESIPAATGTETGAALKQTIRLFIAPEITIHPGSKIKVTHHAATAEYGFSGDPAVYRTHQEIELVNWKEWA